MPAFLLALAIILAWLPAGCSRSEPDYAQSTPEQTIQSALAMVREGNARSLSTLIFADSVELRAVLNRAGDLLGSLQTLAKTVERRMPAEVAALRAASASQPPGTGLIGNLQPGRAASRNTPAQRGGPDGPPPAVRNALQTLLADPFAWIEANASRLTAVPISDDTVALQIDNQPVLPPLGLTMRRSGNDWFFVLPLNLPVVSNYLPQTRQEWSIIASLVRVADTLVKELADDVDAGRVTSLEALARRAGEKVLGPGAIVFIVYQRELSVRAIRGPMLADARRRIDRWTDERAAAGTDRALVERAAAVLLAAANEPLDREARAQQKAPAPASAQAGSRRVPNRFQSMSLAAFETEAEAWLAEVGIPLDLDQPLDDPALTRAEQALEARRRGRPGP
jgi:hypothetical protein